MEKKPESDESESEVEERVKEKKVVKAKDKKVVEKKEKVVKAPKDDVWVTFKEKIVNGDDIDECIDMLKKVLTKKTKRNGKEKQTRKPSPYNKFVSKTMMELKKDESLSAKERLSTAAKMWKELSVEEKEEYRAASSDEEM